MCVCLIFNEFYVIKTQTNKPVYDEMIEHSEKQKNK